MALVYSAQNPRQALLLSVVPLVRVAEVRPKWHSLHHVLHDLASGSRINPRLFANWNNEAFVGRVAKTSRGTHPATTGLRVLQRWLLELYTETTALCKAQTSSP